MTIMNVDEFRKHCFIGIRQAAHLLKCDRAWIYCLLRSRRLMGTKASGTWRIPLHCIKAYKNCRNDRKCHGRR
jgi:hypothetical protein